MARKLFNILFFHILLLLKSVRTYNYADYTDYFDNKLNYLESDRTADSDQQKMEGVPADDILSSHAMVSTSTVFPYIACVMKEARYMAAGALIHTSWVLTNAETLYLMAESIRLLRVRLGSINYKKGGVLSRVKLFEIHPYFDDKRPNYDLALVMLAQPVRQTANIRPIRLQLLPKEVAATHFIVTSWPGPLEPKPNTSLQLQSMEMIKRHRILTVTHLHPSTPEECKPDLKDIGASEDAIMCLEPGLKDPCLRDVGAPVVLNHILWAVVSSWKPVDCSAGAGEAGPVFASLVSARNVSKWLHATVHGHAWPGDGGTHRGREQILL